jgi:type III restriction enzyme
MSKPKKAAGKRGDTEGSPILNGPYDEPAYHYATAADGQLDYRDKRPGRRIFTTETPQVPLGDDPQRSLHDLNDFAAQYRDQLVNLMREQVGAWRRGGYPGVTSRVTQDLLTYWFRNPQREAWMGLFFAQREAVETAIWLNEVAHKSNPGNHVLRELEKAQSSVGQGEDVLPRVAFKMATGTGKTVVMACLIVYHYLNRVQSRSDPRYADYFLLMAPGITIRDRLHVVRWDTQAERDAQAQDYYRQRKLIPPAYAGFMPGLNARVVITNFHAFEARIISGNKRSPMDGKLGPDGQKVEAREDESQVLRRVMPGFKPGRRLLVLNDEAHHCYLPRAKGRDTEEDLSATENERAAVWFSGLRAAARRWPLRAVYDLSATPYYLSGSGWPAYSYFPWVVSDFGLIEAIEAGLVKIPFLPVEDSSQAIGEPVLRNLYEHCKADLPRIGQRTQRREAGEVSGTAGKKGRGAKSVAAPGFEPPPQMPTLLRSALEQFYRHYEDYERGLRERGEMGRDLLSAPPVFIVVCSNTTVSREIYKLLAGYESVDDTGTPYNVAGTLPLFSNFDPVTRAARRKPPTLLIDSDALEHSGQIDEGFKRVFAPEIEAFKRDYRLTHPDKSVEALTDAELLREVVNTVGRPGKLGEHVRCVVSVGMLTEGWDANTVTHIVGVRAFGSQLLCEQVAGRALRRRHYFLDPKTGKFPPEYAHIIGVPFKFYRGGETVTPERQDIKHLLALTERVELEIRFPNLIGYRIERAHDRVEADFSGTPGFTLDLHRMPVETALGSAFSAERDRLRADPDRLRDQEVVYWIAQQVLSRYFRDEQGCPQLEKFGDVRRIAQQWYDTQLEVIGETERHFRRLVRHEDAHRVAASVHLGIEAAAVNEALDGQASIVPLLNRYNPSGSSAHVHAMTAQPVFKTTKSHVNLVVADTEGWEQIAAKTFEQIEAVESYVKNAFLGFEVPYVDKTGAERRYLPDFLCRVKTPEGERFNLIVEITGFAQDKAEKRWFMRERWLPAVNARRDQLGFLPWYFVEVTDIERIKNQLVEEIGRIASEIDLAIANSAWGLFKLIAALPADIFPEGRPDEGDFETRQGLVDDDD